YAGARSEERELRELSPEVGGHAQGIRVLTALSLSLRRRRSLGLEEAGNVVRLLPSRASGPPGRSAQRRRREMRDVSRLPIAQPRTSRVRVRAQEAPQSGEPQVPAHPA